MICYNCLFAFSVGLPLFVELAVLKRLINDLQEHLNRNGNLEVTHYNTEIVTNTKLTRGMQNLGCVFPFDSGRTQEGEALATDGWRNSISADANSHLASVPTTTTAAAIVRKCSGNLSNICFAPFPIDLLCFQSADSHCARLRAV